jgi:zinc protease
MHGNSSADLLVLGANALSEYLPKLLNLMADVARNASFPDDEVALQKQNRTQELLSQRSDASFLADEKFIDLLFAPHPYSRQDPTLESIALLDRLALAGFRDRCLAPNNAVLVLLGALPPPQQVLEIVRAEFASWKPKDVPPPPILQFPEPKRTIVLVNRPGSVQADIRIGRLGVPRHHPDYFPLLVGNTILGGGTSSRLFMHIREQKGYAYDAHSSAQPLKESGSFAVVTQVRNEVLAEAIDALLAEMRQIGAQPVSADELEATGNYLSGVFVIRLETQDGLAAQLAAVRLMGLPLAYLENYTSRVRAVTPDDIRAVAARYVDPERASVVVVGDASKISPQLESFGTVTVEEAK